MPPLLLRAASDTDQEFALSLLRTNMLPYYQRHDLQLDDAFYLGRWRELEQRIAECHGQPVALVSLSRDARALHLRELQVLPARQNQGLGSQLLGLLRAEAQQQGKSYLRLRVFPDSPAQRLYRRHGFVDAGADGLLLKMHCPLPTAADNCLR